MYNAVIKVIEESKQENQDDGGKRRRKSSLHSPGSEPRRDIWTSVKGVSNLVPVEEEVRETDHDSTVDKVGRLFGDDLVECRA